MPSMERVTRWTLDAVFDRHYPVEQRIYVRMYADGTIAGVVEVDPATEHLDPVVYGGPAGFQYYLYDGTFQWDKKDPTRCELSFMLLRHATRLRIGQPMFCTAYVSTAPPAETETRDRFFNSLRLSTSFDHMPMLHDLDVPRRVRFKAVQHEQIEIPPLVACILPGRYDLHGFSVSADGLLYRCAMVLMINADGTATGESNERIHDDRRHSLVVGTWTESVVRYHLVNPETNKQHSYTYVVRPFIWGFRGSWFLESDLERRQKSQHGQVELTAMRSIRVWSPEANRVYPRVFRDVVRLCVHGTIQTKSEIRFVLPSGVWINVFTFCRFDDVFEDPTS
ncbi:hypothetical protein Poli38472_001190 [Pythium oligandrum]|uniref:Uncharacterized protein n=1 Tax=Pythium oligandrum TaxID=41045 RepID=A0A8K1CTM5_PYTOL|nr:hypothetical protein Poli38472_001190 [Pythium oligandrum]|eukprot:TMW69034.1 hypothetical protein Poli38472_001190 [Pythium oligandrum]